MRVSSRKNGNRWLCTSCECILQLCHHGDRNYLKCTLVSILHFTFPFLLLLPWLVPSSGVPFLLWNNVLPNLIIVICVKFPDETLTQRSNGYTDGCLPATDAFREVMPDCPSLESPSASSSPLQQLLFEPTVHPVSFVAKHLIETTSRVPGKRKRHDNGRHVSYLMTREGLLTPTSTTQNHTVQSNGDDTAVTHCLELPTAKAEATESEQFASTPDKLPWCSVVRRYGIADSVTNDTYLLKVPRRCGADVVSAAAGERSATVALFDLSAQKRKSSEKVPEVSPTKQRVSWPTAASSDVSHAVYKRGDSIGSNKSFVTSVGRVPSTSAVSLCDGRQAGRSRNDPHSAPLSKTVAANYGSNSTRRPHISSWSADDVFAFVLSTPHASIYAKVSCHQARSVDFFFLNFIV